jgi:hypothetical protein
MATYGITSPFCSRKSVKVKLPCWVSLMLVLLADGLIGWRKA